jgi:hypothetical protein
MILVAVVIGIIYDVLSSQVTSFATFKANFNAAKQIGIYVQDYNGITFAATESCSTQLIQVLSIAGRSANSINFFVLANESCTFSSGLSAPINYQNASTQNCLNFSASNPSIFINYSSTNATVVKPNTLYFMGDPKFLEECGIAYGIT